jgi:hypothetical protein
MKCLLVVTGSAVTGMLAGIGVVEPMAAYHISAEGCLFIGLFAGILVGLSGC